VEPDGGGSPAVALPAAKTKINANAEMKVLQSVIIKPYILLLHAFHPVNVDAGYAVRRTQNEGRILPLGQGGRERIN
jgi:hypothetical protein